MTLSTFAIKMKSKKKKSKNWGNENAIDITLSCTNSPTSSSNETEQKWVRKKIQFGI